MTTTPDRCPTHPDQPLYALPLSNARACLVCLDAMLFASYPLTLVVSADRVVVADPPPHCRGCGKVRVCDARGVCSDACASTATGLREEAGGDSQVPHRVVR